MNNDEKSTSLVDKKLAFISGGTSGIGLATAELLMKSGHRVIICGRREARLSQIKKQWGDQVLTFSLDVTNRKAVEAFVREQGDLLGSLNLLINNAGLARGKDSFQNASIDDFETMINTNVMGLIYVTRLILPFLLKNKNSHIVNVGSVSGRWVYPGGAVYCASKFAVSALSEGMRMDLVGKPIRVTNIEPGMVETEFSLARFGDPEIAKNVYKGMTPLTAQDIAESIIWCLQRPEHVNIQELVIYPRDQVSVMMTHRKN